MKKRPKIPVKSTPTDYIIEIIGALGIMFLIILPIYFYNDLPQQIPKHFSAAGQVDSYGNRGVIWLLPVVGLILYVGMTIFNKFPFAFNYPVKVTSENAKRLYTLGTRTIRLLKAIMVLSFSFLNYRTIKIALCRTTGIGKLFLPAFLILVLAYIGIMIIKMIKK